MGFCTKTFIMNKIVLDIPNAAIRTHIFADFNIFLLVDPIFFESRPVDILLEVNPFFATFKGYIMKRNTNFLFILQ